MRTTLNMVEDVLLAAREIAKKRGVTVGKVISDLTRQALTQGVSGGARNGLPVLPIQPDARVITLELINRLRDEKP
jgi:hypothetical protein